MGFPKYAPKYAFYGAIYGAKSVQTLDPPSADKHWRLRETSTRSLSSIGYRVDNCRYLSTPLDATVRGPVDKTWNWKGSRVADRLENPPELQRLERPPTWLGVNGVCFGATYRHHVTCMGLTPNF